MAKKVNDAELAKADIVDRPDVTDNTPGPKKEEAATAAQDQAQAETAERDSRIATGALAKGYEQLTGEQANADQLEALTEISLKLFKALRTVSYGGFIGGSILTVCLVLPFIPPLFKFLRSTGKEEKANA